MLQKITRYVAPVLFGLGVAGVAGAQTAPTVTFSEIPNVNGFSQGPVLYAQESNTLSSTGTFLFEIGFAAQTAGTTISVSVTEEGLSSAGSVALYRVGSDGQSIPFANGSALNADESSLRAGMPLRFDGCTEERTSASITVSVQFGTDTAVAASPITALQCVNAYSATVVNDTTADGGDSSYEFGSVQYNTTIAGPSVDYGADGTTSRFNDTATQATHGVLTVTFDPDRPTTSAARNIYTTLANGPLQPGTPANGLTDVVIPGLLSGARGEVTNLSVSVDVPIGVTAVGLGSPGDPIDRATVQGRTANISSSLQGISIRNNPFITGIVLILPESAQQLPFLDFETAVFTGGEIQFDPRLNIPRTPFSAPVELDALNLRAARCGQFDWVADPSNAQWGGNLFRVTGHGDGVTDVMAVFSNAANSANDGTFPLTIPDLTNDVLEFGEDVLNTANSNFGVADVEFIFVGADGRTLDCDRLLRPRPQDLLFSFGNDRITSGHGDD